MLKGKELGQAIEKAFKLKKETGAISSKADIARHFDIKTPSIYDWVKKGSISKDKLPELFRYFADVADHAHWGMTEDEWPAGLKTRPAVDSRQIAAEMEAKYGHAAAAKTATKTALKSRRQERSDMLSTPPRKSFGDKVARKFEEALNLEDNYFDRIENADQKTANRYQDTNRYKAREKTGANDWIARDENERLLLKGWRAASDEMKEGIKALAIVAIKTTAEAA